MNEPAGGSITEQELNNFLGEARRAWLHDLVRNQLDDRPSPREVPAKLNAVEQPAPPPEFGWEAASIAEQVPAVGPSTLSIWLSAGPVNANGSCTAEDRYNCGIYKVVWDAATGNATAERTLRLPFGAMGVSQPAVVRNGKRIAVVLDERDSQGGQAVGLGILFSGKSGRDFQVVAAPEHPADLRPAQPAWRNAGEAVWTRNSQGINTDGWWANLHQTRVEDGRPGHVRTLSGVLLGGADGSDLASGTAPCSVWPSADCVSWRYPDIHHRDGTERITVFGLHGAPGTQLGDAAPIVATMPFGTDIQQFDLGVGRDGVAIEACHHSAWNVSGDGVLCMRHKPVDRLSVPGLEVRALYTYSYNGGVWSHPSEVVASTDLLSELPAFRSLHLDRESTFTLTYKYAHWCGSNRYVVATVFVNGAEGEPLSSRVLLFDTQSAGVFRDLTDAVEALEGAGKGTWRAVYSACNSSEPRDLA